MTVALLAPRHRFSVGDVERMVEAGILAADAPVELLEGELVEMSPQGPAHSDGVVDIAELLRPLYRGRARVREEKPLDCGTFSLPEPDVAVVVTDPEALGKRHPRGDEALLVVEVAFSSQAIDRAKAAVYAGAGVREYWIVDLAGRRIEVFRVPGPEGYRTTATLVEGEAVRPPETRARLKVASLLR